jgi:hypothetical protein
MAAKHENRIVASAASVFYLTWCGVIAAAIVSDYYGWSYHEAGALAESEMLTMHSLAFIGFLLATILTKQRRSKPTQEWCNVLKDESTLLKDYQLVLLCAMFLFGCMALFSALHGAAASTISGSTINGLRTNFVGKELTWAQWVSTHISVLCTLIVIVAAAEDGAKGRPRLGTLAVVTLAGMPLAISEGGRGFILAGLTWYMFSYLSASASCSRLKKETAREIFRTFAAPVCGLLFLFGTLGYWRNQPAAEFNPLRHVLSWPASSISALDVWCEAARRTDVHPGYYSLQYPMVLLDRMGFITLEAASETERAILLAMQASGDTAWCIPKTVIPELIFDFGSAGSKIAIVVLAFLLQWISIAARRSGLVSHVFATMSLLWAFQTVQGGLLNPAACLVIAYAIALKYFSKKLVLTSRRGTDHEHPMNTIASTRQHSFRQKTWTHAADGIPRTASCARSIGTE